MSESSNYTQTAREGLSNNCNYTNDIRMKVFVITIVFGLVFFLVLVGVMHHFRVTLQFPPTITLGRGQCCAVRENRELKQRGRERQRERCKTMD